jgi:hypothetical protein
MVRHVGAAIGPIAGSRIIRSVDVKPVSGFNNARIAAINDPLAANTER